MRRVRDGASGLCGRLAPAHIGLTIGLMTCGPAASQVIEIGAQGIVTYEVPSVFTRDGVTPIAASGGQARPSRSSALEEAAFAAGLDAALVEAVAWRESGARAGVVSSAGAIGEMQLMPATAASLGVDPTDSRQNYRGGAAYLSAMLRRYGGDLRLALAAYNAGPGAVDRYRGVPPFKETQNYVAAILNRLSVKVDGQ